MTVFDVLMEGAEHRFCLRHLYANFKKKFGGGSKIRNLMMAAAKATYPQLWNLRMMELKDLNEAAYEWLMAIPTKSWCRHAFSYYPKCDVLMNNLSESFNATILLARDKPILTMFEWIRTYIMGRFATLNEKFEQYEGDVMPKPLQRLNREVEKSGYWVAVRSSDTEYEVTHMVSQDRFTVDLATKASSCNWWDLVGIPCRHAVAAISDARGHPADFVYPCYRRSAYERTYRDGISPINGQLMWPTTEDEYVNPPLFKRAPGRPRKL